MCAEGTKEMEFYEYFRTCGFTIKSSSKDIKKVADALRKEPGNFRKQLTKLRYAIADGDETADTWDAAKNWLNEHKQSLKDDIKFEYEENTNVIADMLDKIAAEKEETKSRIKQEIAESAPTTADYTIIGLAKDKDTVELFNAVPCIIPNDSDKDLMSCFAILGSAPVFRANGKCVRLMTKTTAGKPQIVFSAGDTSAEGLYSDITAAMAMKYERYMRLLQKKVASLPEYPENDEQHPIEDIFLNDVPTIFRHIVDVKKTYRHEAGEDGKDRKFFRCYSVYAKKTAVPELTVDAFVEWLSSNWLKATRGILKQSPEFKVFSNDPSEMAVSHFVIWPEAEWRKAECPESWKFFHAGKCSERLMHRHDFYIGSLLDANNSAQQSLVCSDPGQTGKSTDAELVTTVIENIVHTNISVHLENEVLKDGNQFGLGSSRPWNYRIAVVNEYDGKSLNSSNGKSIIGSDTKTLQMKNMDAVEWDPRQFRLIVPSNNGCVLMSHAVRRRFIPTTWKGTHSSMDNMSTADKQKLIDDGEAYLKYCWRVYQESPFRQRDGGFFLCCPEDEKLFLEGNFFVPTGEVNPISGKPIMKPVYDDKARILRAYSKDPEISTYYTVDDYEETEITDGFNKFVEKYCDEADSDEDGYTMLLTDMASLIVEYTAVDQSLFSTFGDALKVKKFGSESQLILDYRSGDYKIFKKYLENHGHVGQHGKNGNFFTRIRIKPDYITKEGVVIKPTVQAEKKFVRKNTVNVNDLSFMMQNEEEEDVA